MPALMTGLQAGGGSASAAVPYLLLALETIIVLAGIFVAGTILTRLVRSIAMRAGASKAVANSIRQWILILMIVAAVAAVATLAGYSSEFTTLTISGIGGLAVTLALQSTLSNIIAGIFMLQDGTLRLGDEISFGSVRGEVVKLSLRTTWVKTGEGVIAIIGNSNLSAGPVVNYTAKTRLERKMQI